MLGALALRVGYVMLAKRTEPVLGDQIYYNAQANTIARGDGFTDFRDGSQTGRAPAAHRAGAHADVVGDGALRPGGDHLLAQRLTMTVFGAGGRAGHRVGRPRRSPATVPGCVAAGIAAVYPNLWINDGLVMSETLATLVGGARHPARLPVHPRADAGRPRRGSAPRAASAMLARAELGLLLPFMVLPVALFLKQFPVEAPARCCSCSRASARSRW